MDSHWIITIRHNDSNTNTPLLGDPRVMATSFSQKVILGSLHLPWDGQYQSHLYSLHFILQ